MVFRKRWEVVATDRSGMVIRTERFWLRRHAEKFKYWLEDVASGRALQMAYDFNPPLSSYGLMFTTEMREVRE